MPGWAGPDRGPSAAHHHHPDQQPCMLGDPPGRPIPRRTVPIGNLSSMMGLSLDVVALLHARFALDQAPSKPHRHGALRRGLNGEIRWARGQVDGGRSRELATPGWAGRVPKGPAGKPARLSTLGRQSSHGCPFANSRPNTRATERNWSSRRSVGLGDRRTGRRVRALQTDLHSGPLCTTYTGGLLLRMRGSMSRMLHVLDRCATRRHAGCCLQQESVHPTPSMLLRGTCSSCGRDWHRNVLLVARAHHHVDSRG